MGRSVREMGEWMESGWSWKWRWRRDLRESELQMLNELISVINKSIPLQGIPDSWKWGTIAEGRYTTKAAYEKLLSLKMGCNVVNMEKFEYGIKFLYQKCV
ncbi:hypothetical protein ACS0TY_024334 [Phlomoides rotata]